MYSFYTDCAEITSVVMQLSCRSEENKAEQDLEKSGYRRAL
jgi:hypothetical protein